MTTRPFHDFTRRQRLVRYRDLARIALRGYGMEDAELTFLQYLAKVVYRVDMPGRAIQDDQNEGMP